MDSLITAAARALAAGDPLGALNRVALREDATALALRGIAMAQLGDLERARLLVRRAARAFGPKAVVARARCLVAEAEIAFASRDLGWPARTLDAAGRVLDAHGDRVNAAHARLLDIRRSLLVGHLDQAEQRLATLDPTQLPAALNATYQLIVAGMAIRRLDIRRAREALTMADQAAREARIPALVAEVHTAARLLDTPAARLIHRGETHALLLEEVEALHASTALLIDACRHTVCVGHTRVSLATRPLLFALARMLGEAWPADVPRNVLITQVFRTRFVDDTHRVRLRVEIGRLRTALKALAGVTATRRGFLLMPLEAVDVAVLAQPVDGRHATLLALLADGVSWSSSALALALGTSQRSVQRALDALAAAGKVQAYGRGRARRWITPPVPGFTTALLLPVAPPSG